MSKKRRRGYPNEHEPRALELPAPPLPPPVVVPPVSDPPPSVQSPAPTRSPWRDPALIVAILSMVIAILSVFYTRVQAKVSSDQFERESNLARYRALAVGIRASVKTEKALTKCLRAADTVEACGPELETVEELVQQAAQDAELATYYPVIHIGFEGLYVDVLGQHVVETIKSLTFVQPQLGHELRALYEFDAIIGLDLDLRANDLEVDAAIVTKFGGPNDAGIDGPARAAEERAPIGATHQPIDARLDAQSSVTTPAMIDAESDARLQAPQPSSTGGRDTSGTAAPR